jgi:hypothetical protein
MKRIWTLFFFSYLALFISQPASYSVIGHAQAQTPVPASNLGKAPLSGEASILLEAHQLADAYGIRPYWQKMPLGKGEVPPPAEMDDIIAHLMPCENISRLLHPSSTPKVLDSNNRYSYGDLMFQSSTWQGVEAGDGFTGSPLDTGDAIEGARWAISHGYLWYWSCARILRILN